MDERVTLLRSIQIESLLEAGSQGALILDPDGLVVFMNRQAEAILGVEAGEMLGRRCADGLWEYCEGSCDASGSLNCPLHVTRTLDRVPTVARRPDGSDLPVELSARLLHDPDGNVVGSLETFVDRSKLEDAKEESRRLHRLVSSVADFHGLIGRHPLMTEMFDKIALAAPTDVSVLISGASGTGKELVARAIHERSARSDGPFVAVNCSAIPETLLESSLFGHVKGAFTGATRDTEGYLGRAAGGTLFLDEIGDVTPDVQVKLLRFLQELRYERVGEARARSANVRVVAATNRDMEELVEHGQVREDFYYRISVFPIAIPPMSKRRTDIPPLVDHILRRLAERSGVQALGVDAEVLDIFRRYDWPGNVRELENVLEYAFVVSQGQRVVVADLPDPFFTRATTASRPAGALEEVDLRAALDRAGWNRTRAAAALGISRVTLWKRMKSLGISPPGERSAG